MKGLVCTAVFFIAVHYCNAKENQFPVESSSSLFLKDASLLSDGLSTGFEADLERHERDANKDEGDGNKEGNWKISKLEKLIQKTKPKQRSEQRVFGGKNKKTAKKSKKNKGKKKNKGEKRKKKKKKRQNNVIVEKKPHEGPYGYMHPEEIDWTEAKYRCPECEDTLIIYDPWWGPPPELHIPIFCTSNLSAFDSSSDLHNFGPNITVIFIPGALNCSIPDKARQVNTKQFSIEVSQEVTEDSDPSEEVEPQYDCGKSEKPDIEDVACGLDLPHSSANGDNNNCFWHFFAYQHWRRQLLFTDWDFPSCPDNSTQGECCRSGPHMLISKTGYAKKLTPYCGPDAPKFDKSDFEKGKARWLVLFNNTKNSDNFSPKIGIESPTIGWRKSAAYDQLYYGQKCMCGVRGTKGPKQRPSVDPELAPSPQSASRKLENGRRNSTQRRKAKKKRKTSQNQKGLVKREAFPAKSKHLEKTKEGRKKRRRKKGRKKAMIKGKLRQGEGGAALQGQDVRTRQVWPWMASIVFNSTFICTGHSVSPRIVVTSTRCFPSLFWAKGEDNSSILELNTNIHLITVVGQDELDVGEAATDHWWEEKRNVSEVLIHPNCDSATSPQYCVLALILSEPFNMQAKGRPRAACLNCKVDSFNSKLLKGLPFVAGYGLQSSNVPTKSGSYKIPQPIKRYFSDGCIHSNSSHLSSSESYCLGTVGNGYRCDTGRVGGNMGVRDYGAILMNRVGRKGYKIHIQVVGLLWDFSCSTTNPAEYIPTWPSLSWISDLVKKKDSACVKLVRKSAWTRQESIVGYYENKEV